MMAVDGRIMVTESELATFAQKMALWAKDLSPKERTFLEQMLADAADAANQDASGYANLSSLLNQEDVEGYAGVSPNLHSLIRLVVGYADGIARAEADYAATTFPFGGAKIPAQE
jgi:hypothetical protein